LFLGQAGVGSIETVPSSESGDSRGNQLRRARVSEAGRDPSIHETVGPYPEVRDILERVGAVSS